MCQCAVWQSCAVAVPVALSEEDFDALMTPAERIWKPGLRSMGQHVSLLLPFQYLTVLWKQLHGSVSTCSETLSVVILRVKDSNALSEPKNFCLRPRQKKILPTSSCWVQCRGKWVKHKDLCYVESQAGWFNDSLWPKTPWTYALKRQL